MTTHSESIEPPAQPLDRDKLGRAYKRFAFMSIIIAWAITLLYGLSVAEPSHRTAALFAAFLAAGAPFAAGGLIGFVFGIPKTLQREQPGEGSNRNATGPNKRSWQPNTSLEQISDWLTKIIVGLGLTQLTQIPALVTSTGDYIAGAISPNAPGVAGSLILIVFSISGFVIAYLLTKSDLALEIARLEKEV